MAFLIKHSYIQIKIFNSPFIIWGEISHGRYTIGRAYILHIHIYIYIDRMVRITCWFSG